MVKGFTINGATMQAVIDAAEGLLAPGAINLGWQDISNLLLKDRETVISFGSGTGKDRAIKACEDTVLGYSAATGATERPVRALFHVT